MKRLNYYDEKDVDFSKLYDSIIGEDGAYQNFTGFLQEMQKCRCRRKNPATKERLSNGNLSAFYAFKVNDDFANDSVLKDFIRFAFIEYYPDRELFGDVTIDETLKRYKSLITKGNIVQFRLESPTDYHDKNGDHKAIDLNNVTELRTNYYFYLFITELIKNGIFVPYTEKSTEHLIFSGTDKHIDDLTYATNLSKKGFSRVGKNPVDFGFDPDKFTYKKFPLAYIPRVISYIDQEPIRSISSPIPARQGTITKKYRYAGTGLLTISDFLRDDDFRTAAVYDLSYATRFLFMARAAAETYWLQHNNGYGFDIQYLYSPEEGVYHGVNQGWIEQAVKLAIKYKEYGEPYDLAKVIQFIRATKNENLSYYPVLTFSDYDFGDEIANQYFSSVRKAYAENPEIYKEIRNAEDLILHQAPAKNPDTTKNSENGSDIVEAEAYQSQNLSEDSKLGSGQLGE